MSVDKWAERWAFCFSPDCDGQALRGARGVLPDRAFFRGARPVVAAEVDEMRDARGAASNVAERKT